MREILFRAKRLEDGEWRYGYVNFNHDLTGCYIGDQGGINPSDPKTVGQYTGMKDCAGKKVFEGDIFADYDAEWVGVVLWSEGGFHIGWYGKNGVPMPSIFKEADENWGLLEVESLSEAYVDELSIVGNIHDNPELLKESRSWWT